MARRSRFSQEVRERAVRMVVEQRGRYGSEWETMRSIAEKIGCSAETLRKWVRQIEVDREGAVREVSRLCDLHVQSFLRLGLCNYSLIHHTLSSGPRR